MYSLLRNALVLSIFTLLSFCPARAQSKIDQSINVSVGLGISIPYEEADIDASGFYAQGEYVFGLLSWIDLRPYAGVVFTKTNKDDYQPGQPEYKVTSKAFLMGGKIRISAPIPWVAPYVEGGVGASIGSFETFTPYTHLKDNGLLFHIPFSFGLTLGKNHTVDVAFTYYFHPAVEQVAGAAAVGLSIPLN